MSTRRESRSNRIFRRLLRVFPFEFRRDYGEEMELVFREQCDEAAREGRRAGWLALWWETLAGILRTAPREHGEMLRQDLGYAVRAMRSNLGFTAVAVLSLALGIGANSAIFSLIHGVLLRPLPYPEPDRLVRIWPVRAQLGSSPATSLHDFEDWRAQSTVFESMAVYAPRYGNLTRDALPRRISYSLASADFFTVVGLGPARGRTFTAGEDQPGNDSVAVVSHRFWQRELGGRGDVLGTTVTLDGRPLEVVGVMPPGFDFPPGRGTELWKPLGMRAEDSGDRGGRWIPALARLRSGVSRTAAQAEMTAIARRLAEAYPATNTGWGAALRPLHEEVVGDTRPALLILWAAVGLVLLIVCANLANLLLARGTARRQEIALRAVLGAGRWRLVRQLLSESLLLALAGGVAGLGLARLLLALLPALAGERVPLLDRVGLDPAVLVFTLALALVTGILFGLLPAIRCSRSDLATALKEGDARGLVPRAHGRVRAALVVAEVALSVVVLVAAGLLLRSLADLVRVDPGFGARGVLSLTVAPPWGFDYTGVEPEEFVRRMMADRARAAVFYRELLERVAALPGVASAGAVNRQPLEGPWWGNYFVVEGRPVPPPGEEMHALARVVMPGYSATLGIPLVKGRLLRSSDEAGAPRVVVINQAMARTFWPDADPLGQRIDLQDYPGPPAWATVVGIVGDVRYAGLQMTPMPAFYRTFPQGRSGHFDDWGMRLLVRAEGDPLSLIAAVRREVAALDPGLPVYGVRRMDEVLAGAAGPERFRTVLLGGFAALALVLTAVGVYGVTAYTVALRTHEMGVRVALGAPRARLVGLVVGQGMALVGGGALVGLILALGLTRFLASLLYGVGATDPGTFVAVGLVLLAATLAACILPARRAARVDPILALRRE